MDAPVKKSMAGKAQRPSPLASATSFKVGHRAKGNDGAMYVVVASKTSVKRWKKVSEGDLKSAVLIITPSVVPFGSKKGFTASKYLANKKIETRYEDLVGPKALSIVRSALSWIKGRPIDGDFGEAEVRQVLTIAFDMARLQYVVNVKYKGTLRDLKAIADDMLYVNYSGADTWMEGDIRVNDGHELFLKLARVDAA